MLTVSPQQRRVFDKDACSAVTHSRVVNEMRWERIGLVIGAVGAAVALITAYVQRRDHPVPLEVAGAVIALAALVTFIVATDRRRLERLTLVYIVGMSLWIVGVVGMLYSPMGFHSPEWLRIAEKFAIVVSPVLLLIARSQADPKVSEFEDMIRRRKEDAVRALQEDSEDSHRFD